jgi:hypothetical protein
VESFLIRIRSDLMKRRKAMDELLLLLLLVLLLLNHWIEVVMGWMRRYVVVVWRIR